MTLKPVYTTAPMEVGIGVVVWQDETRECFLAGTRRGSHGEGTLSLPGGKADGGCPPEFEARRELHEETALYGMEWKKIPHWTYDPFPEDGKHFVTIYYECILEPGEKPFNREPEKCDGWKWYSPKAIPIYLTFSGMRSLYDEGFLT